MYLHTWPAYVCFPTTKRIITVQFCFDVINNIYWSIWKHKITIPISLIMILHILLLSTRIIFKYCEKVNVRSGKTYFVKLKALENLWIKLDLDNFWCPACPHMTFLHCIQSCHTNWLKLNFLILLEEFLNRWILCILLAMKKHSFFTSEDHYITILWGLAKHLWCSYLSFW